MNKLLLIAVLLLTSSWLAFADESKPIVLSRQNLTKLKNSSAARSIGKAFEMALASKKSCPQCAEFFSGAKKYRFLFKRPFLIVDKEPNELGGNFLLIVFKGEPKVYRIWVYDIGQSELQVREVIPLRVNLNKEIMGELQHKDYFSFWNKVGYG